MAMSGQCPTAIPPHYPLVLVRSDFLPRERTDGLHTLAVGRQLAPLILTGGTRMLVS